MTEIPPSRYKVVERGRRLVVIDTRTGQPATHDHAPPSPPFDPTADRSIAPPPIESFASDSIDDHSGSGILTTARLYDIKGPRRIVMTDDFSSRLGRAVGGWLIVMFVFAMIAILFLPWLWIVPAFILLQPKAREAIRQWITTRLDEADRTGL